MMLFVAGTCLTNFAYAGDDLPMERNTLELNCHMTVQFPTLPDAPSFTADAFSVNLVFWRENGQVLVQGEDIPTLVYSTKDAPGDLPALTVKIEGMPGTTSVIKWSKYPTVTMSPVDLRVRAYDKVASSITAEDQPVVDIILSDLTFSTEEISVAGFSTAGYLDAEELEAQIVSTTILPEYDFPMYEKWLEGEPVLIELRIKLPNPFAN